MAQELDELNVRLADACVRGQLDASPFLQGILLQMLRKLDKDRRGVSMVGRPLAANATEHELIAGAAFEFALAGRNRELAAKLGQQLRPKPMFTEDLPKQSLPNPTLALSSSRSEQLRENLLLIHRRFEVAPGQQERRLMMSLDHTYLTRHLAQTKLGGIAGLVGPAWNPCGDDLSFLPFSSMSKEQAKSPAAALMLECLCWNPSELGRNRCFSIASAPMSLKATVKDADVAVRERNQGKWVTCLHYSCNF